LLVLFAFFNGSCSPFLGLTEGWFVHCFFISAFRFTDHFFKIIITFIIINWLSDLLPDPFDLSRGLFQA